MRAFLTCLALIAAASPALAELPPGKCGPVDGLRALLGKEPINEVQQSTGVQFAGEAPVAAFEVWANEATGTWTVILSGPDGKGCMIAEGFNWNELAAPIPGDPA